MTPGARRVLAIVLFVSLAPAASAAGQQPEGRYVAWVNASVQAAMPSLRDRFTFDMHAEDARVDADYRAKSGLLVDGGVAVRVRRNFGVGLSISRFGGDGRAGIVAQIPYPFEFNKFREVAGASSGLDHVELAYHVQLRYSRPLTGRLRIVLSGGPAAFSVRRHLVTDVRVDEQYPFDTAAFRSASTRPAKGTGFGFHAGADVAWMFNRRIGVGTFARYARGTADLQGLSRTVSVDTGGLESGAGLRVRF